MSENNTGLAACVLLPKCQNLIYIPYQDQKRLMTNYLHFEKGISLNFYAKSSNLQLAQAHIVTPGTMLEILCYF
jgi:hypothetical protein